MFPGNYNSIDVFSKFCTSQQCHSSAKFHGVFFPPVFDCLSIKGGKACGWIDLGRIMVKGQGSRS